MIQPTRLALLSLATPTRCDVDSSSYDLIMFKLRHVDIKQFARRRASTPIRDLATGAQFMFESLYVNDFQVRCMSYVHLFKLIELRSGSPEDGQRAVKQDVVEALSISEDDRAIYFGLFTDHQPNRRTDLFRDAIESLERAHSDTARDAWLELIKCAKAYTSPIALWTFLKKPKRAAAVANFEVFKSVPTNLNKWHSEGSLKSKVLRAIRRFEQIDPNLRPIDQAELDEARKTIESFDDDQMAVLRCKLSSQGTTDKPEPITEPVAEPTSKPTTGGVAEEGLPSFERLVNIKIEIIVPIDRDDQRRRRRRWWSSKTGPRSRLAWLSWLSSGKGFNRSRLMGTSSRRSGHLLGHGLQNPLARLASLAAGFEV